MTQKERMEKGLVYYCADEEIMSDQEKCLEKLYDYNATRPSQGELRAKLLKDMFAEFGEGSYIEPPLHSNWGGKHTHFGKMVYANGNLYEGQWEHSQPHGQGKMTFADGSVYEGIF